MNAATDPIKHIVVLMLENRSFDQMLGSLKSSFPDVDGIDTKAPGSNSDVHGNVYFQQGRASFQLPRKVDPMHEFKDVEQQLDDPAPNGGFIRNFLEHYPGRKDQAHEVMDYFEHRAQPDPRMRRPSNRLDALHSLAESFLICDKWFSSVPGPTWPNRFFVHSGTSKGRVHMPHWFKDWHWYDQTTVFDRLNERGMQWRVYHGDFPQSLLLAHQLRPRNLRNYHRMQRFFDDAGGPHQDFPSYSFIEPSYFGGDQNDQHPPSDVRKGDELIASVYNAIRANEELWQRTMLVVTYDEHGGFYDHVSPGPAQPPDGMQGDGFKFDRYGVRVPAVLISPWVPRAVDHTPFDHTSLLKYMQEKWSLGPLGARTAAANSLAPLIQGPPRTNTPGSVGWSRSDSAPEDPELNDLQADLLNFSDVLEQHTVTSTAHTFLRAAKAQRSTRGAQAVAMERLEDFLLQHAAAPDDRDLEPTPAEESTSLALDRMRGTSNMVSHELEEFDHDVAVATRVRQVVLTRTGTVSEATREFVRVHRINGDAVLAELRLTDESFDEPWPLAAGSDASPEARQLAMGYLADVENHLQGLVSEVLPGREYRAMIIGASEGSLVLAAVVINISWTTVAAGGGILGAIEVIKDYPKYRDSLVKIAQDVEKTWNWFAERTRSLKERLRGER